MPEGTTVTSERSVPKPVFTDAEAGAKEFPSSRSRSYNYFEPRKRRATVYEDVTMDVQPDPARHLTQGWVYSFANGDAGYPQEWSALKSTNWHAFLDPNEEWDGETGLVTDVVDRMEEDLTEVDAYLCGPPPMVEATIALLERKGVPEAHIYYDKFTTTADE